MIERKDRRTRDVEWSGCDVCQKDETRWSLARREWMQDCCRLDVPLIEREYVIPTTGGEANPCWSGAQQFWTGGIKRHITALSFRVA